MHQHTHGAQCEYYGRNRNIYIYEAREEIQKNAHCCFQPFAIKSIRMGAFFYLFKRDHSPLHFLSTLALALEFRSCMYLAEYALSGTAMRSNLHEPTTEGKAHTKKKWLHSAQFKSCQFQQLAPCVLNHHISFFRWIAYYVHWRQTFPLTQLVVCHHLFNFLQTNLIFRIPELSHACNAHNAHFHITHIMFIFCQQKSSVQIYENNIAVGFERHTE